MIEFQNVYKTFSSKNGTVDAVKNVSLKIEKGDIFGVIGFSGAGKSTLVRMVNALEKPTVGTVFVNGEDVGELRGKELRDFRKKIGMVFQHFNLLESRTVEENIAVPFKLEGLKKAQYQEKIRELLEFVELSDKAKSYPRQLSGGQKQRVGIARALALNPEILLCDEATSALDPRTTDSILQLVKKINRERKITVLMITHQMNVIQSVCNKVAVMEKGVVVESGSVIEVFGNPKTETSKGFVRTVINDELPPSVVDFVSKYEKPQKLLRLRFEGQNADDPVLSDAIKNTGANISIMCGIVTELEEKLIGFQTVHLTGEQQQIDAALQYLEERKIGIQEIDVENLKKSRKEA